MLVPNLNEIMVEIRVYIKDTRSDLIEKVLEKELRMKSCEEEREMGKERKTKGGEEEEEE